MFKRLIFIGLLHICYFSGYTQSNVTAINTETYNLYLAQDWDKLIFKGNDAINSGFDFYYLRYRVGIAYYQQKQYRKAITHFEKAYKMNSEDNYLRNYLYYSYIYAGREPDAINFIKDFPQAFYEMFKIPKQKKLKSIDFTYASSTITDDEIATSAQVEQSLESSNTGYQYITKSFTNVLLGIEHSVSPRLSIYHAVNILNKTNYFYSNESRTVSEDNNDVVNQYQYYAKANYLAATGFNIHAGLHLLNVNYSVFSTGNSFPNSFFNTQEKKTLNNQIAFVGASKDIDNFNIAVNFSFSNLEGNKQFQKDLSLTYYPFSNLNFYSITTVSHFSDKSTNNNKSELIGFQKFGITVKQKIWIELYGIKGNIRNFTSYNSLIVYNSLDLLKHSIGGNVIIPLYKSKILLNISYSNSLNESRFIDSQLGELDNSIKYNANLLIGGIKWKF